MTEKKNRLVMESPNVYAFDEQLDTEELSTKHGEFEMETSQRYDEAYTNMVTFIVDEKTRYVLYASDYEVDDPQDNTHYALLENVVEGNDDNYVLIPPKLNEALLDRVNALMRTSASNLYQCGLFGRLAWNENGVAFLSVWKKPIEGVRHYEAELKKLVSDLNLSWDNVVLETRQEGMGGPYTCIKATEFFHPTFRKESISYNELKELLWK